MDVVRLGFRQECGSSWGPRSAGDRGRPPLSDSRSGRRRTSAHDFSFSFKIISEMKLFSDVSRLYVSLKEVNTVFATSQRLISGG